MGLFDRPTFVKTGPLSSGVNLLIVQNVLEVHQIPSNVADPESPEHLLKGETC